MEKRIAAANRAYFALLPILKSQSVHRNVKLRVYKILIRPVLTNGAEAWIFYAENKEQLIRFLPTNLKEIGGEAGLNQDGGIVFIKILKM